MRKIPMERKLFEIFGLKFFVYENFQDQDLNIDDKSIYQFDDEDQLVDLFALNQFFAIWHDERRINAGVICACEGNLYKIISFMKEIGVEDYAYSTSDCGIPGEPTVLYLPKKTMDIFIKNIALEIMDKRLAPTTLFYAQANIIYN
ncbi:MAG: hypothetical protein H0U70_11540 [Tatlockia sp.]|nr:hypothetical protein [Tatlockia sp.]